MMFVEPVYPNYTSVKSNQILKWRFFFNCFQSSIKRFISDNTTLDQEQCLLDQNFIKDDKITVSEYVKSIGDVTVTDFKRVSLV